MTEPTRKLRVPSPSTTTSAPAPKGESVPSEDAVFPDSALSAEFLNTQPSGPIVIQGPIPSPVAFPGYEILGELGRGGMGVVYKARQTKLNRLVALKVIIAGPHASVEDKTRFRIEAEAGARLHHPNIVQVYDIGEHAGFAYMALELVEGGTLRRWQQGKLIAPRLAVQIAAAIGRGILHAHEHGILHRDLKPANILIANGESITGLEVFQPLTNAVPETPNCPVPSSLVPKITDFGLAKAMVGGADITTPGMACGTPNYMAPEQVRGSRLVGAGVDVYGLGAVLYELLAGCPPFVGSDAAQVMDKILRTDPPPVRKLVPTLPRDLSVIVGKCLEKDPTRRYLTVRDLMDDLGRFLTGLPIHARPAGRLERCWRWIRRNPIPAAFIAISACGCAVTGMFAIALARSLEFERVTRTEATTIRKDAEAASDQLRVALAAAQAQRTRAEDEQRKAEENLRIARQVIRTTLLDFTRDNRLEGPEFRGYRETLISTIRRFRDEVAAQAAESPEWLHDLVDASHLLGILESSNDNPEQAAIEFGKAVDAAKRWETASAGKAEVQTRRATVLAYSELANVLQQCGNVVEQLRAAESAVVQAFPLGKSKTPEDRRAVTRAQASLWVAVHRLWVEAFQQAEQ